MERAVSVVVVTYDGLPWVERCLESVSGYETIVVDHGSTDGTIELVRERFPDARLLEQANKGLGAGSNVGMRIAAGDYFLLLNSDAWAVGDAVERLTAFAEEHPEAAVVGPRLLNPDGSLQPSVRGFPTLWRLATEYFFLRKLAPRSRALNAFYGSPLRARRGARGRVPDGRLPPRPPAGRRYRRALRRGLLHVQRGDGLVLPLPAGRLERALHARKRSSSHVGGATTARNWGPMYREQLRGHLRFMAKHHGLREAERARRLLLASMRLRSVVFRGERRAASAEAARWLSGSTVPELLEPSG